MVVCCWFRLVGCRLGIVVRVVSEVVEVFLVFYGYYVGGVFDWLVL